MTILFMFIIPMKMKHFVIFLAIINILAASAGGDSIAYFAHLGGLAAGYLFVRWEGRVGPKLARFYYRMTGRFRGFTKSSTSTDIPDDDEYQREVDRLLDKIFREGTASLSEEENEFLKDASRRFKKGG
jgi:hypothetical protein